MVANYTILQPVDLYYGTGTKNNTPTTLMLPGDNKGHVWTIPMLSQGMPADITETLTANGYFQRADGNVVLCPGTVTGNVVTVTLLQACYAIEGNMLGVVRVTNATTGMITTLCEANFRVSKALNNEIIDPGEVIPDIDNLLAQIAAMEAATEAANAAAANATRYVNELKYVQTTATEPYYNMIDQSKLLNATDWAYSDELGYYGKVSNAVSLSSSGGFKVDYPFKENTRYTLRYRAYGSTTGATGNLIHVVFFYTDGTYTRSTVSASSTTWATKNITSDAGKTVSRVGFQVASSANYVVHFSDMMLVEGTQWANYEVYAPTAVDAIARAGIASTDSKYVRFDAAQTLTSTQKQQVLSNIGAPSITVSGTSLVITQ